MLIDSHQPVENHQDDVSETPKTVISIAREEFSEVIVEERDSFVTISSHEAPSEYINPEYESRESSARKLNIDVEIGSARQDVLSNNNNFENVVYETRSP